MKGVSTMKKQNHQAQATDTIEKIEQIIESAEPGAAISIDDIAGKVGAAKMNGSTRNATIMLLKKYGVKYTL
jgi:hypothetical protein